MKEWSLPRMQKMIRGNYKGNYGHIFDNLGEIIPFFKRQKNFRYSHKM